MGGYAHANERPGGYVTLTLRVYDEDGDMCDVDTMSVEVPANGEVYLDEDLTGGVTQR